MKILAALLMLVTLFLSAAHAACPAVTGIATTGQEGDIAYNSNTKTLAFCNGSIWRDVEKKRLTQTIEATDNLSGTNQSRTFYATCPAGYSAISANAESVSSCFCTGPTSALEATRTRCAHNTGAFTTGSCPTVYCNSKCVAVCQEN